MICLNSIYDQLYKLSQFNLSFIAHLLKLFVHTQIWVLISSLKKLLKMHRINIDTLTDLHTYIKQQHTICLEDYSSNLHMYMHIKTTAHYLPHINQTCPSHHNDRETNTLTHWAHKYKITTIISHTHISIRESIRTYILVVR